MAQAYLSLQVVCAGLLTLVWGVNCAGTRTLKETNLKKKIDSFVLCKSFCVKEYLACYQNDRCHKTEIKQRINFCIEQYREYMKKCLEEFHSTDFHEWIKKYMWTT